MLSVVGGKTLLVLSKMSLGPKLYRCRKGTGSWQLGRNEDNSTTEQIQRRTMVPLYTLYAPQILLHRKQNNPYSDQPVDVLANTPVLGPKQRTHVCKPGYPSATRNLPIVS